MGKKDKVIAFLGEQSSFEGSLSFTGTLQIDGKFRGDIRAEGNLIIGRTGKVESKILATHVVINGEFHGNIRAEQCIEICVPAKVYGDIQAPTVIIHKGVFFEGSCRTQEVEKEETSNIPVLPSERAKVTQ